MHGHRVTSFDHQKVIWRNRFATFRWVFQLGTLTIALPFGFGEILFEPCVAWVSRLVKLPEHRHLWKRRGGNSLQVIRQSDAQAKGNETSPTQWIVMIPLSRGSYIFHMKRNCAIQRSNNLVPIQKRCFVAQVRQITAKKYISFFNKVVLWQAAWTMWWSVGKFPPSSTSLPPTDSKKGITTLPKTSYGPWVDIWQMFSKMHWQYKCRHFVTSWVPMFNFYRSYFQG